MHAGHLQALGNQGVAGGFLQTLPRDSALAFDNPIPFYLGSLGTFTPATCHV